MQSTAPLTQADLRAKVQKTLYKFEILDDTSTWVNLCSLGGKNYLKSISCTPSGAGPRADVIAGKWNAEIKNPGGVFHNDHPTSSYTTYFRVGRQVRISIGVNKGGTSYYWQRLIGFMDAPSFNHKGRTVSLSGCDFSKVLADFELRSPDNFWGAVKETTSIATAATLGNEIYDESDAMDIDSEAANCSNWTEINASFASQTESGGGSTYVGRLEVTDEDLDGNTLNENVGSFTAGKTYVISFKYKRSHSGPGNVLSCHVYKTGTSTVWGGVAGLGSTAWATASFQFTCPESAAGRMKFAATAPAVSGRYVWIDQISIKEVTGQVNARYELPAECNGPYYATLDDVPYWLGDDEKGWHYDEVGKIFYFDDSLTIAAGLDLDIHYLTIQTVENVVADILAAAGLYADRAAALAGMNYVATGVTVDRVKFDAGTKALAALQKLCERVNYRFWFSYDGTPNFRPRPTAAAAAFDFTSYGHLAGLRDFQDLEQIRNRVSIEGEERAMYESTETKQTSRFTGSTYDQTSITAYKEHTESIQNDLFQDQASIDAMCATRLAEGKDPKWFAEFETSFIPAPLEIGDTVTWLKWFSTGVSVTKWGVITGMTLNNGRASYTVEVVLPVQTISPGGIASAEAFGSPTVTVIPNQTISPSGISSAEAFGSAAVKILVEEEFNADDTFVVPSGVTSIEVEAWGQGGGGGSRSGITGGGGGGGGAYSKDSDITVTPSESLDILIGQGGLANPNKDTELKRSTTTLIRAASGDNAIDDEAGDGGQAADGIGDTKRSGGNGAPAQTESAGGGAGSSAGTSANGNSASDRLGATAPDGGGDGGDGGNENESGTAGAEPGGAGGGSGGTTGGYSPAAGTGARGKMVIRYWQ